MIEEDPDVLIARTVLLQKLGLLDEDKAPE